MSRPDHLLLPNVTLKFLGFVLLYGLLAAGRCLAQVPEPASSATPSPKGTSEPTPVATPETVESPTLAPEATPSPDPTTAPSPLDTPTPTPAAAGIMPSASPTPPLGELELIHMGDLIDVSFAGGSEYNWRGPLKPDGDLDGLDEVAGPIRAICLSEQELSAEINRIYSKILRQPGTEARIVDRSGRPVARLDGAVKTPSRFRVLRPVRLRELIVAAGGFTDETSGDILVMRPVNVNCTSRSVSDSAGQSGNGLVRMNITIKELLKGDPAADPFILGGDLIRVGKAEPIYVMGAVSNPRPIYTHTGLTLSRAIDIAGGLAKGSLPQDVTVFRRDGAESRVINADLDKIKSGQANDVDLEPFDIIDVASKGRPKRERPPVISFTGATAAIEPPLKIIE